MLIIGKMIPYNNFLTILSFYFGYVYAGSLGTIQVERPGKPFCLEKRQEFNCSNQIIPMNKELKMLPTCLMRVFNKTARESLDRAFTGNQDVDLIRSYGEVNINPFLWHDASGGGYTSLNITLTNIRWKRLKFRFKNLYNYSTDFAREFVLTGDVNPSSIISFDCLWNQGKLDGEKYKFQYVITTIDDMKLLYTSLLQVPDSDFVDPKTTNLNRVYLENYKPFMMLAYTKRFLKLRVQVPPPQLNFSKVTIKLYRKKDEESGAAKVFEEVVNFGNTTSGDFINIIPFNIGHYSGIYYYNATTFSTKCDSMSMICSESSTPHIYIKAGEAMIQTMIAILLVVLLVFGIVAYQVWKKKVYKAIVNEPVKPPIILFVYDSSYPSHIDSLYRFKGFLEDNHNVIPKMDLVDIPLSEKMDPFAWYFETMKAADFVLVFAPPGEGVAKGVHPDNIFDRNLTVYAHKLLLECMSWRFKCRVGCVKLPGCTWDRLLPEALCIKRSNRFSLHEDLKKMNEFLRVPELRNESSLLLTALQQHRKPSKVPPTVLKPNEVMLLPLDKENSHSDNEGRAAPFTKSGNPVNLDGQPDSEESDDGSERSFSTSALIL